MRRAGILIIAVALFAAMSSGTSAAQAPDHTERKVVSRIPPFYPEIAKRMRITGVVRLEVVVRANGKVKSSKVLGGSPVLIQPATEAVSKWKFETAPEDTTEEVQIVFELPQS
ncbi:MAG: energy transducer TonB [Terriglobales bacterium]